MIAMTMTSPLGPLRLVADGAALAAVELPNHDGPPIAAGTAPVLDEAARQLAAYFAGRLTRFALPLAPRGTPFQHQVWRALAEIPHGATQTYGELARAIGRPTASRAVGAANGHNPLAIIVPCHRVIGAGGALTGYAGGIEAKRWLLAHEAVRGLPR
jgi:methylated-DNA-[protein]-cysteine S-methyltransferase